MILFARDSKLVETEKDTKKSDLVDTPVDKACVSSHRTQAEFVLAFDIDTTFQLCGFTTAQPVNVYSLYTGQLSLSNVNLKIRET